MPHTKPQRLNKSQLKKLQSTFLLEYPLGFADPKMQVILKKHPLQKLTDFAHQNFSVDANANVHVSTQNMATLISRSSMVSMFEKPKFKRFISALSEYDKAFLVDSLLEFLHANQQRGFEGMLQVLATEQLAKWSLISAIPAYYSLDHEIFVKPTTTKNILRHFNITDLAYKPSPSWDFYQRYRDVINEAKTHVHPTIKPNNPAFCGFLMMTTKPLP